MRLEGAVLHAPCGLGLGCVVRALDACARAGRRSARERRRGRARAAVDEADFTVGDIKVEGLQRVSEGTVYNYLPVNIGDTLTPQRVREAIRALYAHRLLPRRAASPRRQHARRGGARAALHRELRDHRQQGHQDRRPAEVPAQRRPRHRQDLRPLGARGREAVPHGPVLQPRQVRRAHRHERRGGDRQPRAR